MTKRKVAPKKKMIKKAKRKPKILSKKEELKKLTLQIRGQIAKLGSERDVLRNLIDDAEQIYDDFEEAGTDAEQGLELLQSALDTMSQNV